MYRLLCRVICKLRVIGCPVSDYLFVKALFFLVLGEKLDLKNPRKFNEKIQWLKVHDHNPLYHKLVDKIEVKDYVSKAIGEEYVIKTLGVWDDFDSIEWDSLPSRFVLKTSSGGGSNGVVVCKNKEALNKNEAKRKLETSMKCDIYKMLGEWAYKKVLPRILAEEYLEPRQGVNDLPDYKWFCFDGEPKYCQVIQDRNTNETIDFFDTEWNHQEFVGLNPAAGPAAVSPTQPANLKTQIWIARELSKGLPFSRIDLYETGGDTYFGEITFYPASGLGSFRPQKYDNLLGDMIKITGGGKLLITTTAGRTSYCILLLDIKCRKDNLIFVLNRVLTKQNDIGFRIAA